MSASSAKYRAALSSLLTGDLWTSDSEEGLRPEQAALHLASVQAKALLLAVDNEEGESERPGTGGGWLYGHKWTRNDTLTMLSGLVSFLEGSRVVLEQMRDFGGAKFVPSGHRIGCYPDPEVVSAESEQAFEAACRANASIAASDAEPCTCEANEGEARP